MCKKKCDKRCGGCCPPIPFRPIIGATGPTGSQGIQGPTGSSLPPVVFQDNIPNGTYADGSTPSSIIFNVVPKIPSPNITVTATTLEFVTAGIYRFTLSGRASVTNDAVTSTDFTIQVYENGLPYSTTMKYVLYGTPAFKASQTFVYDDLLIITPSPTTYTIVITVSTASTSVTLEEVRLIVIRVA